MAMQMPKGRDPRTVPAAGSSRGTSSGRFQPSGRSGYFTTADGRRVAADYPEELRPKGPEGEGGIVSRWRPTMLDEIVAELGGNPALKIGGGEECVSISRVLPKRARQIPPGVADAGVGPAGVPSDIAVKLPGMTMTKADQKEIASLDRGLESDFGTEYVCDVTVVYHQADAAGTPLAVDVVERWDAAAAAWKRGRLRGMGAKSRAYAMLTTRDGGPGDGRGMGFEEAKEHFRAAIRAYKGEGAAEKVPAAAPADPQPDPVALAVQRADMNAERRHRELRELLERLP